MTTVPRLDRPTETEPTMARTAAPVVPQPVRVSRGSNFELYSWYYFRVSGVLILVLALGHLAIMHLIFGVEQTDFNFVANRWSMPIWRIYDWLLLLVSVTHGANGVRIAIDDYVRSRGWRLVAQSINWVLMAIILMLGTAIVLVFQPPVGR